MTGELSDDAAHISAQTDGFAITVPNFREALVRTIRVSADAAISSVVGLGDSLLHLSAGRTTVARTRGLALRAQREFRTVHEQAREALVLATDLGVEITYWRTRAESCARGVRECRTLAGEFARGAEAQVSQAQERIAAALADSERATQAYQSAQDRKRSYRRARRIRYVSVTLSKVPHQPLFCFVFFQEHLYARNRRAVRYWRARRGGRGCRAGYANGTGEPWRGGGAGRRVTRGAGRATCRTARDRGCVRSAGGTGSRPGTGGARAGRTSRTAHRRSERCV